MDIAPGNENESRLVGLLPGALDILFITKALYYGALHHHKKGPTFLLCTFSMLEGNAPPPLPGAQHQVHAHSCSPPQEGVVLPQLQPFCSVLSVLRGTGMHTQIR
eukprot:1136550-Pelagomonas_calceolata.AAC.3